MAAKAGQLFPRRLIASRWAAEAALDLETIPTPTIKPAAARPAVASSSFVPIVLPAPLHSPRMAGLHITEPPMMRAEAAEQAEPSSFWRPMAARVDSLCKLMAAVAAMPGTSNPTAWRIVTDRGAVVQAG